MVSIDRLKKLKNLAEHTDNNESKTARILLKRICESQNIDINDIDNDDNKPSLHWFKYHRGNNNRGLLAQCIFKTLGNDHDYDTYRNGKKCLIGIECTNVQAINIELDYEFYHRLFEEEVTKLLSSFIQVNDIFPPDVKIVSLSEEECTDNEIYRRSSIDKHIRHNSIEDNSD